MSQKKAIVTLTKQNLVVQLAGECDNPLSPLRDINAETVPMAAVVAGMSVIGQYLNENGDLPCASLGYAFQAGLCAALKVCVSEIAESNFNTHD
jgi:hypothetical protein